MCGAGFISPGNKEHLAKFWDRENDCCGEGEDMGGVSVEEMGGVSVEEMGGVSAEAPERKLGPMCAEEQLR